jgi:hypothetical protein
VSSRKTLDVPRMRTVTGYVPPRSWPTTSLVAKWPLGATLPPLTTRSPKYSRKAARGGPSPVITTGSPGKHVKASSGGGGKVALGSTGCCPTVGPRGRCVEVGDKKPVGVVGVGPAVLVGVLVPGVPVAVRVLVLVVVPVLAITVWVSK